MGGRVGSGNLDVVERGARLGDVESIAMCGAMVLAAAMGLMGQAKASMIGREKPWWEKLKREDVVVLDPIPGTAIPLVRNWRFSEVEGRLVRDTISPAIFAEAARERRWDEVHKLADRDHLVFAYGATTVQVVGLRQDPVLRTTVADVVILSNYDANGMLLDEPIPRAGIPDPYPGTDSLSVPVAYLGRSGRPRHPMLALLPVLIRRPDGRAEDDCPDSRCSRMEAIPHGEMERIRAAVRLRREESRRRAKEEAKRERQVRVVPGL